MIGPYDPQMPHQQWRLPERPAPSSLESRAHEIAARAIPIPTSLSSLSGVDRVIYEQKLCTWLGDVHALCLNILNSNNKEAVEVSEEGEDPGEDLLKLDLSVIQRKIGILHKELDKEIRAQDRGYHDGGDYLAQDPVVHLLQAVEADLQDVQQTRRFSALYDRLEESIVEWNSLAEAPYNLDGEYLQEHAYNALYQYTSLQGMFIELQGIMPRSPEQNKLLQEKSQDLNRIKQTFTRIVLPALKEKLQEAQKNYQSAAKAMTRSGIRNRWTQDTASSLLTDYANLQYALADLRFKEELIEGAVSTFPPSEKETSQALSRLLVGFAVTGKSVEAAEKCFIDRLEALSQNEKEEAINLLQEEIPWSQAEWSDDLEGNLPIARTAFLHRIYEVTSRQAANPYFQEISAQAKKMEGHISAGISSAQDIYQIVLSSQYTSNDIESKIIRNNQEKDLIDDLNQPSSEGWQQGLGVFFLLLHAGAAVHNIQRMQQTASNLPRQADRLQQEFISLVGKRAERGAAFIGIMLSDKYDDLRTMSESDLQRMTKRFPDVRETLEPFRQGAPKPSSNEIFEIHQRYVLQHANATPSLKEQINNWYTQFTTSQAEEIPPESMEGEAPAVGTFYEELAPSVKANLNAYLLDAVSKGLLDKAEQLVEAGADLIGTDINIQDEYGKTLLHRALEKRNNRLALVLAKGKADPNVKDLEGSTPISLAFKQTFPNEELIIALIKAGGDPHGQIWFGIPFIHRVVQEGMVNAFKVMLAHGADPNAKDDFGDTPVSVALRYNNEEMVIEIIKAGGDPNGKIQDGTSFLQLAIEKGMAGALKLFLEHGAAPRAEEGGVNALLSLAFASRPVEEIIITLIKAGGDPNGKMQDGTPFIHKAITTKMLGALKTLLAHGADPNMKDVYGDAPLSDALILKNEEMVIALIDAGANPNGKTLGGAPYIHRVVAEKMVGALKVLLAHGADPNVKDVYGDTPLNDALILKNEEMVIVLIDAGSDIHEKTRDGIPYIHKIVGASMLGALKALLAKNADVNVLDKKAKPPIFYAENEDMVNALLEAGALLKTPDGRFVFNEAIQEKKWKLVCIILTKEPSYKTHLKSNDVQSLVAQAPIDLIQTFMQLIKPADYPEAFSPAALVRLGQPPLLSTIISQGFNVDARDRNGMTALHWAYFFNLPDVTQFLLSKGANEGAINRFGMLPASFTSGEQALRQQVQMTAQQLVSRELPPEALTKLQGKAVNKGISKTYALHALPLLPTPLNASGLDAGIAELVQPTAISKVESLEEVRNSIPLKTGALRQRLGSLTGKYLDELFLRHPIPEIRGFCVPETIIEPTGEDMSTPASVTRFVPLSVDMKETNPKGISQEEWTKLLVLDMVLGNTDRHMGNYRVQTTVDEHGNSLKRIVPIDHDLTLPDLTTHNEYKWGYLPYVSDAPFSEEWKAFILGIDADALWKEYEREAAVYGATYADYTKGETGINDNVYLNFQARIKALQEGTKRGWSPNAIGKIFLAEGFLGFVVKEAKCKVFFDRDNPKETREERRIRVFDNINNYFTSNQS